jgi:OOP family OmpA-OmpF porin
VTLSSVGLTQTLGTKVFDLAALGILPIAERFGLYGKLGLYRATMDVTSNIPGAASLSVDNTGLTYGVGLQYDVTRNLALRAEWQQFANMGGGVFLTATNVDLTSIAAIWRFK